MPTRLSFHLVRPPSLVVETNEYGVLLYWQSRRPFGSLISILTCGEREREKERQRERKRDRDDYLTKKKQAF